MAKPRFKLQHPSADSEPLAKRARSLSEPSRRRTTASNWVDVYTPQTTADIAIHKLKLAEIANALEKERVIVISGPAGSVKSTAVRVLARQQNRNLVEWSTPDYGVGETRILDSFRDFLTGCTMHQHPDIVFIDDMPNVYHDDTRSRFEEAILTWQLRAHEDPSMPTLVIVFTETDTTARYQESAVASRIFGSALDHAKWIKTNPVNTQLLTKLLKKVASEQLTQPATAAEQIKFLSRSGDVRNALNTFEFWARGSETGLVGGRGEAVGLFHAIGKAIYGSDDPETVAPAIEAFDDSREMFALTLLENYTKSRKSQLPLHVALDAVEMLSLGDLGLPDASIGVATVLNHKEPNARDHAADSKFVPLGFTQFPKWRKEQAERHAFLQRWVRAFRMQGPASSQFAAEVTAMQSQGLRPKLQQSIWNSDSDYDSD